MTGAGGGAGRNSCRARRDSRELAGAVNQHGAPRDQQLGGNVLIFCTNVELPPPTRTTLVAFAEKVEHNLLIDGDTITAFGPVPVERAQVLQYCAVARPHQSMIPL
jgi:hypothetical protein